MPFAALWLALMLLLPTGLWTAASNADDCPSGCSLIAAVSIIGQLPEGASLTLAWTSAQSGRGVWVQAGENEPECTTCTPCKARLNYLLDTGGNELKGCDSPDGGETWATAPNDAPLSTPVVAPCGSQSQVFRIAIHTSVATPCGPGTVGSLNGFAFLDCLDCAAE